MPRVDSKIGSTRKDGRTEHRFAPTPSMPTYLVAVTVGRLSTLTGEAAGVPLHIFTAPGKQQQAAYAMEVTKRVVPFFTEYFGVPYSLPKLDQLAVPGIRDGAMEDWGLISYSEDCASVQPCTQRIQRTARGVQHGRARSCAPMVRQSGHRRVMGGDLAQRGVCELDGNQGQRTLQPRMARTATPSTGGWNRTMTGDSGSATRAIRAAGVTEQNVFDVFDPIYV